MPKAKYSRDSKARQKGHQLAPSKMSQKQLMTRFGKKGKKGELAGEPQHAVLPSCAYTGRGGGCGAISPEAGLFARQTH